MRSMRFASIAVFVHVVASVPISIAQDCVEYESLARPLMKTEDPHWIEQLVVAGDYALGRTDDGGVLVVDVREPGPDGFARVRLDESFGAPSAVGVYLDGGVEPVVKISNQFYLIDPSSLELVSIFAPVMRGR